MSALIKRDGAAAAAVRPFVAARHAALGVVAAEPSPEAVERDRLQAECARLEAALAAARTEGEQAAVAAREEGRKAALDAVQADDEKKLAVLSDALARASDAWDERLAGLDGLAARIAAAGIAGMFGDWQDGAALVARAAAHRIAALRREAVLAVHVSAKDFPDVAALVAVAARLGRPPALLAADPDLDAGECRIDLKLGHVDVGPRSQWALLSALLDDLAEGRAA